MLAQIHTVVCPDLRGIGSSSQPADTPHPHHVGSSKRAKADDGVALMRHLSYKRFAVVGHDRGAYTAFRMALDHLEPVSRLVVLDAVPILEALYGDVLAVWQPWAKDLQGFSIDCGHHMAEEAPEELADLLISLLG